MNRPLDRSEAISLLQSSGRNALELEAISRHFGALVALADINLTVGAGERRAILGSNGAGKTTLFNAITGDFPPTTGRVRLFGEDVTDLPVYERIRRGLRRTYQISQLFGNLGVLDNLYLACRGVSRGRFSLRRPRPDDSLMAAAETHRRGGASDRRSATRRSPPSATASSASSRSAWRWPARRGSSSSTNPPPASRRPSGASWSRSCKPCRATSPSS